MWTRGDLYGSAIWRGPNTAMREWRNVVKVGPLWLLGDDEREDAGEIDGQEALFGEGT